MIEVRIGATPESRAGQWDRCFFCGEQCATAVRPWLVFEKGQAVGAVACESCLQRPDAELRTAMHKYAEFLEGLAWWVREAADAEIARPSREVVALEQWHQLPPGDQSEGQ